jgi:hypothetical protein
VTATTKHATEPHHDPWKVSGQVVIMLGSMSGRHVGEWLYTFLYPPPSLCLGNSLQYPLDRGLGEERVNHPVLVTLLIKLSQLTVFVKSE